MKCLVVLWNPDRVEPNVKLDLSQKRNLPGSCEHKWFIVKFLAIEDFSGSFCDCMSVLVVCYDFGYVSLIPRDNHVLVLNWFLNEDK